MAPRLKEKYYKELAPKLKEELGIANVNDIPKLEKIVVNMGVGEAATDSKLIDAAVEDLRVITGQQPMICRAKKSIATFKLRAGMPIGAKVTLRGDRMYEFFASSRPRFPASATSAAFPRTASMAMATIPWALPSRSSSRRSTTTRSTAPAAWTSRS